MGSRKSRPPAPGTRQRTAGAPAPLAIVILAAGEGKRMKSTLPKVLQPLAGRPLLKHVIDTALALSPASIQIVYGHGGDAVRAALAREPVAWTLQAERLGTGHALQQAIPQIPDGHTVLVLYGDVPLLTAATLTQLVTQSGPRQMSLLTARLERPEGYGRVVRNRAGAVQRVVEQKDASRAQLAIRECNTGVLAAPARLLRAWLARLKADNSQREYYLTDVIAMAVKERISVRPLLLEHTDEVLGVNDKRQLAEVERLYRARAAHRLLDGGVTLADPERIDVRGEVVYGSDVFIDVNVVLEGRVVLADRVQIAPGCLIRDSEIGAGTQVFACSVIESARVGSDCHIGPFARLRPQAQLAEQVHIGNFVEVKNSQMGRGAKANHLSYVGDAQVGREVNIGAGTIVANYDGAHKHPTVVGDGAHTGSNSVLVAPITVGAGATIAAGSTVTHSVPAGKLTIARARQVTVEDWQRPLKSRR
jgi:bifunctional UDP-N-acetylglucosamine pyrophosphorylase/glucosamine-1-phosphate N-acetyltransferase